MLTSKATLTACLALLLAGVAQCAVSSSRLQDDREEQAVVADVVEDVSEEKTKEIGVLAQRTGFVLSRQGTDLEQLAQEEEATYKPSKKAKGASKKVLSTVGKIVITEAVQGAGAKLVEHLVSRSRSEENPSGKNTTGKGE
ncbi:uncharacterized protein LOC135366204 [Ornithodoros turicata]|uniref:uncharacterized protein LOC135366204 n=1 Tax=Ornithodoros turicata TaxID=34597 RepID=UPI00313A0B4C